MRTYPAVLLIIALVLLEAGLSTSQEEMFLFVDDYYKAVGFPQMTASAINPVLVAGENTTLQLVLANEGLLQELIPTDLQQGSIDAAYLEMKEEKKCTDAQNIVATLRSNGPLEVISPPQTILYLADGNVSVLSFIVRAGPHASGQYQLTLDIDFERQMDTKISGDKASPLYIPDNVSVPVDLKVNVISKQFALGYVDAKISPGKNSTIMLVIRNSDNTMVSNCTASLLGVETISVFPSIRVIGDMAPGELALTEFYAIANSNATPGDYKLTCQMEHTKGIYTLAVPVTLLNGGFDYSIAVLPIIVLVIIACLAFILYSRYFKDRRFKKRRWS